MLLADVDTVPKGVASATALSTVRRRAGVGMCIVVRRLVTDLQC